MNLSVSKESPSVLSDIRMMNHAVLQAIPYKAKFVLSSSETSCTEVAGHPIFPFRAASCLIVVFCLFYGTVSICSPFSKYVFNFDNC